MQAQLEKIQLGEALFGVKLAVAKIMGKAPEDAGSYERGRRDGEQAARQALAKERMDLDKLHQGIASSVGAAVPRALRDCESDMVRLAVQVAERLVAGVPVSAEMVEGSIRETVAQVEDDTEVQVQLHPEDLALLRRTNSPLLETSAPGRKLTFQGMAEITRGGCVVKTRFGVMDGRRESKLEAMKQALHAAA